MTKISDAEWKIMNLLWDEQPRTMTQITKALFESTGSSRHTVIACLKRMEEKNVLHHEEGPRRKLYYADLNKEDAILQEKNSFLDKVFKGNAGLVISTMPEKNELSGEEIDQLIKLLQSKKQQEIRRTALMDVICFGILVMGILPVRWFLWNRISRSVQYSLWLFAAAYLFLNPFVNIPGTLRLENAVVRLLNQAPSTGWKPLSFPVRQPGQTATSGGMMRNVRLLKIARRKRPLSKTFRSRRCHENHKTADCLCIFICLWNRPLLWPDREVHIPAFPVKMLSFVFSQAQTELQALRPAQKL